MSREQDNKIMAPPTKVGGTIMIPAKKPDDLMVPPKPVIDNKLDVAGGNKKEMPQPPEMEIVELSDGRFAKIPKSAICETKEEAENSMMPPPPIFPHGYHHRTVHHDQKDKRYYQDI